MRLSHSRRGGGNRVAQQGPARLARGASASTRARRARRRGRARSSGASRRPDGALAGAGGTATGARPRGAAAVCAPRSRIEVELLIVDEKDALPPASDQKQATCTISPQG